MGAFAAQIHAKMREQLEQEAAFMDIALKGGVAVMKGALAIEDDIKVTQGNLRFNGVSCG